MKMIVAILLCSVTLFQLSENVYALDKMQAHERLQKLVNDPVAAREMRRKIQNSSEKELSQYNEIRTLIDKEINTIASSLPRKIDKHTTMDSASISGNNISYKYTLSDDLLGIEYEKGIMLEMKKMLKNNVCSSPSGAWLILGYTWSYFYFRESGKYYGSVIIDAKLCGFE